MNLNRNFMCGCCAAAMVFLLSGCAVPRLLWPQNDIAASETINQGKRQTVLIASRSSEYKKTLVAELHNELAAAKIPQKTIGVDGLRAFDTSEYPAVVVINTCLAWGLDYDIETFLKNQKSHTNIILLTTSADGQWLPDKLGRDYDAISGASMMTNIDALTQDIMSRILEKLNHPNVQKN